jgi:ABC-type sugar transport system substrate-binding protein
MGPTIKKAHDAGIPMIAINSLDPAPNVRRRLGVRNRIQQNQSLRLSHDI